jgi:hypothetical protein
LIKYASRSYCVEIPGYSSLHLDYDKIRLTKVQNLRGLARLLHVIFAVEAINLNMQEPVQWSEGEVGMSIVKGKRNKAIAKFGNVLGTSWYEYEHINDGDIKEDEEDPSAPVKVFDKREFRDALESTENQLEQYKHDIVVGWDAVLDSSDKEDLNVAPKLADAWDGLNTTRVRLNTGSSISDVSERYYREAMKCTMPASWLNFKVRKNESVLGAHLSKPNKCWLLNTGPACLIVFE